MYIAQKHVIILGGMPIHVARGRSRVIAAAALAATIALASTARAHDPDDEEIALGSLVDAELAFARLALEQGIRGAFLANFAADGIVFEPAPVRLHDAWPKRPPPPDPKALRLVWQPAQAGVARDRAMGYTTGAFTLTDAAHPDRVQHGIFFSVWRRETPAGRWRVVLDAGVVTPGSIDFVPLGAAPRARFAGRATAKSERRALVAREARTFRTASRETGGASYARLLAPDVRLHRDGMPPMAGSAAVARYLAARATSIAWTPIDVCVATSGDFAYSYGSYRETGSDARVREGYYAHLWLRDAAGRWRLAYDIATAGSR
jgi:ketosteroid isomerase-like protein